ncbi:hypothetical protein HNY73_005435 [Argiope bruennichi]|uniref:Uncharacterized protein n=1 Tax=Argiope bruennichi TaxID=94029 RepID=A0A8T0FIW5_ARGBR|nr:hypothetical protein HNY73_005435 [Argiope bruennichi]
MLCLLETQDGSHRIYILRCSPISPIKVSDKSFVSELVENDIHVLKAKLDDSVEVFNIQCVKSDGFPEHFILIIRNYIKRIIISEAQMACLTKHAENENDRERQTGKNGLVSFVREECKECEIDTARKKEQPGRGNDQEERKANEKWNKITIHCFL